LSHGNKLLAAPEVIVDMMQTRAKAVALARSEAKGKMTDNVGGLVAERSEFE
jgi:hypothetical protein